MHTAHTYIKVAALLSGSKSEKQDVCGPSRLCSSYTKYGVALIWNLCQQHKQSKEAG